MQCVPFRNTRLPDFTALIPGNIDLHSKRAIGKTNAGARAIAGKLSAELVATCKSDSHFIRLKLRRDVNGEFFLQASLEN